MEKSKYLFPAIIALAVILIPAVAFSSVNKETYWTFETTGNWNALYGAINDVTNIAQGDSVGVFDKQGNCYGAGFYDGKYYYLSAFEADKGDKTIEGIPIAGDFAIPGFEPSAEVVFKVYVDSDGKEYTLEPAGGTPYIFASAGQHPAKRIDLVYKPPPPSKLPLPKKEKEKEKDKTRIISGGLPYVRPDEKPPEVKGPPPVIKEDVDEEEVPDVGVKEEVTPPDYYRAPPAPGRRKVKRDAPKKPAEKKAPYKAYEPPVVKKRPLEIPELEIKPITGWPFWLRLLLLLLLLLLLYLAGRKLMCEMRKEEKENAKK